MLKKVPLATLLSASLISLSAHAQSGTEVSVAAPKSLRQSLRDQGHSLIIDTYTESTRAKNGPDGLQKLNNTLDFVYGYRLSDKDSIRILAEVNNQYDAETDFKNNKSVKTDLDVVEAMYKRNLHTFESTGITLWGAVLGGAILDNGVYKTQEAMSGYVQGRVGINQTLGAFSHSAHVRFYDQFANNYSVNPNQNMLRVYYVPEYQFNELVSANIEFRLRHRQRDNGPKRDNTQVRVAPAINFQVADAVTIGAYTRFAPFVSNDGETVSSTALDTFDFGINAVLTAF